jgi:hypothetical protein
MTSAQKINSLDYILSKSKVLGNSHRGLKELCSDVLNDAISSEKDWKIISKGTFLSVSTLKRMALLTETEHGDPYRPQADTCERILRYFNTELVGQTTRIKSQYRNQPKHSDEDE